MNVSTKSTDGKIDVRKWLGRARSIDREIETLRKVKEETRERLLSITQSYNSNGAQSTKNPHKYDKLVELEAEIDGMLRELLTAKKEITKTIDMLEDGRQRTVLLDYYVRMMTLEEIAVEMHYSYEGIKKIRRKAIEQVGRLLGAERVP